MERIVVKRFDVPMPGWPGGRRRLRIAHLSDLHLRTWNRMTRAAQQLLMGLEYELLAVTGDFGEDPDRWRQAADLARRFFAPIQPRLGTFGVLGNHDSPRLAQQADINVTFLRNESRVVSFAGGGLAVGGVEQTDQGHGDANEVAQAAPAGMPVVFLAHYPSTIHALRPGCVGLVLAGHTHGGQIRLPVLGCVWAHDRIRGGMARGLHLVGPTHLHVSAGVGVCRALPFRMLCPAEISILTLRAPATDARTCLDDEPEEYAAEANAENLAVTI